MTNQPDKLQKQKTILDQLQLKAEQLNFGTMVVELKVQDGKITSGEIIEQKIKLG